MAWSGVEILKSETKGLVCVNALDESSRVQEGRKFRSKVPLTAGVGREFVTLFSGPPGGYVGKVVVALVVRDVGSTPTRKAGSITLHSAHHTRLRSLRLFSVISRFSRGQLFLGPPTVLPWYYTSLKFLFQLTPPQICYENLYFSFVSEIVQMDFCKL